MAKRVVWVVLEYDAIVGVFSTERKADIAALHSGGHVYSRVIDEVD